MVLSCHHYSSSFFLTLPYVVNLISSSTFLSLFNFFHTLTFMYYAHFSFPVILLNLCASLCPLFLLPLSNLVSLSLVHLLLFFTSFFPHYFSHSCITLISIPFFSSSSFPSLLTFFPSLLLTFEGEWGSTQLTKREAMTSQQTWYTSICSGLKIHTTGHTQSVCSCTQHLFPPPRTTEMAQLLHNWGLWARRVTCCWTRTDTLDVLRYKTRGG